MIGKSRSRRGISSILGIIIAVGIIVTVIVPLFLYTENIVSLREQYIVKRHNLDEEKMEEALKSAAYEDLYTGTHQIMLRFENTGYLAVRVVRIWVIRRDMPTTDPIEKTVPVPPRSDQLEIGTGVYASQGKVYDIKVVTERGNIYVPVGSPITGWQGGVYPWTLSVTIMNMEKGKEYTLEIDKIGEPGPSTPPYMPKTLVWKATAENQFQSLSFGVTPGTYTVVVQDNKGWQEGPKEVCVGINDWGGPTVVFDCGGEQVPPGQEKQPPAASP